MNYDILQLIKLAAPYKTISDMIRSGLKEALPVIDNRLRGEAVKAVNAKLPEWTNRLYRYGYGRGLKTGQSIAYKYVKPDFNNILKKYSQIKTQL